MKTTHGIQTKIARALSISNGFLSDILSGKKRPSWPVSKRLEKATGISAVAWIDGKVDRAFLEEHYSPGMADRRFNHGRRITKGHGYSNETEPEENG